MIDRSKWRVAERQDGSKSLDIRDGDNFVCSFSRHPRLKPMAILNAARIVACVKACEGISDVYLGALEGTGILAKANHNADVVKKQRDSLLEALGRMVAILDAGVHPEVEASEWALFLRAKDLLATMPVQSKTEAPL